MPLGVASGKQFPLLFRVNFIDGKQWQCGDSYFTKCSPCSFDRAAHDPHNLLNPLHPSITPLGAEKAGVGTNLTPRGPKHAKGTSRSGAKAKRDRKSGPIPSSPVVDGAVLSRATSQATIDDRPARTVVNGATVAYPRDATTRESIPLLPLSEIGKASRFGDKMAGDSSKCSVFEVVLQSREKTACPACVRSPKRAGLPAHARGCFGLS